jgi:molybdate/tungstate transport system substrate-binding protein
MKADWRALLAGVAAVAVWGSAQAAEDTIKVTYAGSMGVVMDKAMGPTFAKAENLSYQGQGQGSYGLARLLASKKLVADVFVSITPGPMDVLKEAGLIDQAEPVASTRMVIAYNPNGPHGAAFKAAAENKPGATPWFKLMEIPGLRIGRTDPTSDPQGQNIIFTMMLAEKYYKEPGLVKNSLGETMNPQQVFGEGGLLSRLEAGQVDATSGYESAAISAHQPYVTLPEEINLSNPNYAKQWYDTVSFSVRDNAGKDKVLHPQPLVFYAAVLKNAPDPEAARKFVKFLESAEGRKLFTQNGYGEPKGGLLYH